MLKLSCHGLILQKMMHFLVVTISFKTKSVSFFQICKTKIKNNMSSSINTSVLHLAVEYRSEPNYWAVVDIVVG
jgi:hypothetical protein